MALELFQNAVLILALLIIQIFFVRVWISPSPAATNVISGLTFGLATVAAMALTVNFTNGFIFDARSVVLSVAALFGGPVVAGIAATIGALYRYWLGGAGVWIGIFYVLLSAGMGLVFRAFLRGRLNHIRVWQLFLLGLAVHLPMLVVFSLQGLGLEGALVELGPPYVTFLTLATMGAGLGFREIERLRGYDAILEKTERHMRSFFSTTPIGILELDFSHVWLRMNVFRERVDDLQAHFAENPGIVTELVYSIRVLRANPAALCMLRASSQDDLDRGLLNICGSDANKLFEQIFVAIWRREPYFDTNIEMRTREGQDVYCFLTLPLPTSADEASEVTFNLLNTAELRNTQFQLLEERRRLHEILWATNVGTWEWNVQTGEIHFNSRWAHLIGYQLSELEPLSIDTWKRLAHPDDLEIYNQKIIRVMKREKDYYENVVRMKHKDGYWVWIQSRGRVVEWSDDNRALRMSGIIIDVTDIKNAG